MAEIGFYIDPQVEHAMSLGERAVVEKHGFEVRKDGGLYALTDPVVRKANRGKGGHHVGVKVSDLLAAAVAERRAHDESKKAPSDKVEKQNARARADAPKVRGGPDLSGGPNFAGQQKALDPKTDGDASNATDDKTKDAAAPSVSRGVRTSKRGAAKKAEKAKPAAKTKAPKVRKDVRYVRAFRAIFAKPGITVAQLSREADLPAKSATAWIDIWNTAVTILADGKKLSVDPAALLNTTIAKK